MYLVVEAESSSQRNFSQNVQELSRTIRKQGLRGSPDRRFKNSINFILYKQRGRLCPAFLFPEMDNPYISGNEY
jgi:hypothetical protein